MASALAKKAIRHECRTHADDRSDEDLLDQFLTGGKLDGQDAFRALVERHGPMVLGVCRYVLNQDQDAEDAFQATFLQLSRKGASIRNRRVLAGWLHEIAYRIALRSRASAVRRRTLERQGMAMVPPVMNFEDQGEQVAMKELRPVLHEEVDRLPDKYRIPVILSYLEGKTNEEVAAQLQWPVGTVKGRLSRARDLLRSRLTRRGLALSAAFLMTALSRGRVFAELVPAELVRKTVKLAAKTGPAASAFDPSVTSDPELPFNDPAQPVELITRAGRRLTRPSRLAVLVTVFLLVFLSFTIGKSLAVLKRGDPFSKGGGVAGSAGLSELPALLLSPFSRGSCH